MAFTNLILNRLRVYTIIYLLVSIYAVVITPTILKELKDYIDIFSTKDIGKLPLNKVGNYIINIDRDPLYSLLYNLLVKKLTVL